MRKLELNVSTCVDCPFCRYDSHYSMSYDSGYDCHHPDGDIGRLVDDHQISGYHGKLKEIENQNKSLFKYQGEIPKDPFIIPDKCPLEKI